MKGLILCVLTIAVAHGFVTFRFENRCDNQWPIWDSVPRTDMHIYDLPGRKTLCLLGTHGYRGFTFERDGKTLAEFQISLMRTFYDLNIISGYDVAMRIVPTYQGLANGTVVECLNANCPMAVHSNDDFIRKQHKTLADTMHIILCPEKSQEGMSPKCLHTIE